MFRQTVSGQMALISSRFGNWKYSADRNATMLAYSRTEHGGADTCDCAPCRNFRVVRTHVFPDKFLKLLEQLGVDPLKDAEVYHIARLAPGRHNYGGWYHFIGTLEETGDFPVIDLGGGFEVWMCNGSAPRLTSFTGLSVVQVEFHTKTVPWLLDEPESF